LNESGYKMKLVKEVNALPGGYARRIEDRFSVGVLDMIIKLPGLPLVFAEGKVIDGNVFSPTPRQYEEGKRIGGAGLEALLIGWRAGVMYISPWVEKADRRECFEAASGGWAGALANYLGQKR
jgi:hypothetical protein